MTSAQSPEDKRKADILRRLLAARAARDSLLSYVRFTMPDHKDQNANPKTRYITGRHHELMARRLEDLEAGRTRRVIINMGPRHGKTELASKKFMAWFSAKHPEMSLVFGTYNETFAGDIGRAVRDNIQSPEHRFVFPEHVLKEGSEAAQRLETPQGGQLSFVGRGGTITGRGGHGIVLDDPIKDRKEADSKLIRDQLWTWFTQVIMTRQMTEDSWVILIQCMTGDTPVMLPNGDEKPLADIRPGDKVASYTPFGVVAATVKKFSPQGLDSILAIKMKSGIIVRANARHPFLVDTETGLKWQRTATLKKGSRILRVIGENTETQAVRLTAATSPSVAKASAPVTTTKTDGLEAFVHLLSTNARAAKRIFGTAMELALRTMNASSLNSAVFAQFAGKPLPPPILEAIGQESCAWITAMTADTSGDFSATTATSPSDMASDPKFYGTPLTTLSAIHDEVENVTPAGEAEVFDIEVEGTANFIANGLVSHNTRWHEDDLVGRLTDPLNAFYDADEARQWTVIDLPALAFDDGSTDVLGRAPGEALWPERFPVAFLKAQERLDPRGFQALYQGRPSAGSGVFFQNDWLKTYRQDELPANLRFYVASDHAVSTIQTRDKTAMIPVGVDEHDNIWVLSDVFWEHAPADKAVDAMLRLMEKRKPLYWWAERGHITKSIGPFLRKRMHEEGIYVSLIEVTPTADKQTRAQSIQGRMAMGKVYFPAFAPWWPRAKDEILKFPNAAHDDFVDALAYIGLGLAMQVSANNIAARAPKKENTFGSMFAQIRATQAEHKRNNSGW